MKPTIAERVGVFRESWKREVGNHYGERDLSQRNVMEDGSQIFLVRLGTLQSEKEKTKRGSITGEKNQE